MANDIYIEVRVRTNVDKISAFAVHDALLFMMVDKPIREGARALKEFVPEGETHRLKDNVGYRLSGMGGSVGIPAIEKPSLSTGKLDATSRNYPIFVDKGTGVFGKEKRPIFAKKGKYMKLPPKGDFPIFHRVVKGQPPQRFMAQTYAFMLASLTYNSINFRNRLAKDLKANKDLT